MIFTDFIIKFAIIQKIIKMKKIVFVLTLISLVIIGCKNKPKQQENKEVSSKEVASSESKNIKKSSFKITGMSCNIGCAKKIQSDLSKKEGVVCAKVVFADSTATVKYDATKIDKAGLATFIEGIADGKTYEVTKISDVKACKKAKKSCGPTCTKQCGSKKKEGKQACKPDCKKKCDKAKKQKPCSPNCTKQCGSKKKETAKNCSKECKKECCTAKATSCKPNCTKPCCA